MNLDPGIYEVTLTLGDLNQSHSRNQIFIEDALRGNVTTEVGEFVTTTYEAIVVDGQLTLQLLGSQVPLNALEIRQLSAGTPAEVGELRDTEGLHYFLIEDIETGFVIRGSTNITEAGQQFLCGEGIGLAPETHYRQYVYQADTQAGQHQ